MTLIIHIEQIKCFAEGQWLVKLSDGQRSMTRTRSCPKEVLRTILDLT